MSVTRVGLLVALLVATGQLFVRCDGTARPACATSRYFEGYASDCETPAQPAGGGFCEYDGANTSNACWDWSFLKSAVAGACR